MKILKKLLDYLKKEDDSNIKFLELSKLSSVKISIIVPVYMAEKYLHRCVDSLLAQTFQDFEILLIDDGSPDNSGEICDIYAQKDLRVRVFHKENGGVSSARQCGIDNAYGEYTIHVDPDDWVEPTMLEELYEKVKKDDVDMLICDYYEDYTDKSIYIKQEPSSLESDIVLKEHFKELHGSCCNKLIRRSCYERYNISFPLDLTCSEDLYVCVSLLKHPITVAYLPKAFYHYTQDVNTNSLVKRIKTYEERLLIKEKFCQLMSGHKYYNICLNTMVTLLVSNSYIKRLFSSDEFKEKFYIYRQIILLNNDVVWHYRLRLYLSCIGYYRLVLYLQNIIYKCRSYIFFRK